LASGLWSLAQAPGLLRDVVVLEFEGFTIVRKVSASCDPDVGPGDAGRLSTVMLGSACICPKAECASCSSSGS